MADPRKDAPAAAGPRGLDPETLTALRLDRTRQAYHERDLSTALLEAEELLDEEPDHVEALEVLGDTEIELGHGREAGIVFDHLLELAPGEPLYLAGLAIARFLHTDFDGAVAAGRLALERSPELAEAHAYVGLSLERLGRQEEAAEHLERARELDPEGWPTPRALDAIPWQDLLQDALAQVPEELGDFLRSFPIVFQLFPDPSVLRSVDPPISPLVLALYEGRPTGPGHENGLLPRSMRVFQGNAQRFAGDMERLAEDLAHALAAEAADWLGLPVEAPEEP